MTITNDTPANDAPADDGEVKNPAALLRRNKELMAELKAAQAQLKTAQEAHDTTLADVTKWRDRWYRIAVDEPLEVDLSKAATVPVKYLRDLVTEHGLLRMEPDSEGLLRPRWYTVSGKPDDNPLGGASGHLVRALHELGTGKPGGFREAWAGELENAMHRATGSGALGSSPHGYRSPAPPKPAGAPAAQGPVLGLR